VKAHLDAVLHRVWVPRVDLLHQSGAAGAFFALQAPFAFIIGYRSVKCKKFFCSKFSRELLRKKHYSNHLQGHFHRHFRDIEKLGPVEEKPEENEVRFNFCPNVF
jgi:hypothetical protein